MLLMVGETPLHVGHLEVMVQAAADSLHHFPTRTRLL